jgi:two-component system cell cycle response regulator
MRVLVAHGRASERRRLADVVTRAGHEVIEADDRDSALAACREAAPDVAVLAAELGDHLVACLKADATAFSVAVLVVEPTQPSVERAVAALERGVQDLLVAPVGEAELVTRIHAAGRTKGLQEELVAQAGRLEAMLFEDPLTRIANRRFILAQLAGLISGARRHERPLSVAIIDIDHFKAVNDIHGHAEGDRVLCEVARALRATLRAEDQLGRLGGEEFLALLPDAAEPAAATEHLRASVAATGVTVSIGWAAWEGETLEAVLARADDALYSAKAAGRDCVVGAPATLPRRR